MTKSGSDAYQAGAKLRSKRDRFSSIFLTSGFFLRKPCGSIGSTWFPSVLLQSAQRTQRVNCLSSKICKNQSSWIENFKRQQEAEWKLGCQASAWWVNHLLTLYCAQSSELFTWHLKDCPSKFWRVRFVGMAKVLVRLLLFLHIGYWLSLFLCQTLRIHTCLDVLMYLIIKNYFTFHKTPANSQYIVSYIQDLLTGVRWRKFWKPINNRLNSR